jgi:hypothetical protein
VRRRGGHPLPAPDGDPRFNAELLRDAARLLAEHGYPPVRAGADLVELRQALYGFLYRSEPGAPWRQMTAEPALTRA